MVTHQHDTNCNELWLYFQTAINWVKATFPRYRREMKGLEWGVFYNKYGTGKYNSKQIETRILDLIQDEDISKYSGVYEYLLGGEDEKLEKVLSIRAFSPKMVRAAYERQKGVCPTCKKHFDIENMQVDHITPWSKGGRTTAENCQMLCAYCNQHKSNVRLIHEPLKIKAPQKCSPLCPEMARSRPGNPTLNRFWGRFSRKNHKILAQKHQK